MQSQSIDVPMVSTGLGGKSDILIVICVVDVVVWGECGRNQTACGLFEYSMLLTFCELSTAAISVTPYPAMS